MKKENLNKKIRYFLEIKSYHDDWSKQLQKLLINHLVKICDLQDLEYCYRVLNKLKNA